MTEQGYINHIGLVLDASSSMSSLRDATVKVADNQVKYLASRSQELDQETRMTIYTFADSAQNVFYDKDVLRLPSLAQKYRPYGNTALIDATMLAIQDLEKTATLYGDHAFLLYVLTDGEENASRRYSGHDLLRKLNALPNNWTLAVLAPNARSVFALKQLGFAPDNIQVWDTTEEGIREVGRKMEAATNYYMSDLRTSGVRSTRSLFNFDKADVAQAVKQGAIQQLDKNAYSIYTVDGSYPIKQFVEDRTGKPYRLGSTYYELMKSEAIQASKQIVVVDTTSFGGAYTGREARNLLGLPDYEIRVNTAAHPQYDIFVQSTSVNRKLVPGQRILVMR